MSINSICRLDKMPRVVITGLGAITSLGADINTIWKKTTEGSIGIKKIISDDILKYNLKVYVSAPVNDFCIDEYINIQKLPPLSRFEEFALAASAIAIKDAKIISDAHSPILHPSIDLVSYYTYM